MKIQRPMQTIRNQKVRWLPDNEQLRRFPINYQCALGTSISYRIQENKVSNYQRILVRVTKKYLTVSLTTNENTAESDIIKSVSVSGTAGKFGIPNVIIVIPTT